MKTERSPERSSRTFFPEAAQERNIEVGVGIRHEPLVKRLAEYFTVLRKQRFNRVAQGVDDRVGLHSTGTLASLRRTKDASQAVAAADSRGVRDCD
jgi:hypothetical protein